MKTKGFLIYATLVFVSLILLAGCKNKSKPETSSVKAETQENKVATLTGDQLVQRGNYLVVSTGCHDCHSPKKMGPEGPEDIAELMFSGYEANNPLPPINKKVLDQGWMLFTMNLNAAVGPWGISFAANLTSDQTGIGNWPEENFIRAIKKGNYKGIEGGRTLLPPMPWQNFANLTDEDIKAMFAYFKTTKPVHNVVPLAVAPADIK
jgi:hypothetical protein